MSFIRVSKSRPCPICKKPDWCRVFADGWVECMRVQSDRPAKSGGWMHGDRECPPARFSPQPPPVKRPTINATKMMRDWVAETSLDDLSKFASHLGVSVESIASVGAAWAAPHNAWAFPMCDGYGEVIGIRLRNERGKFAVGGSRQGIFIASLPAQETLFVCEGPTDTAAMIDIGLFAVGRPNCCCGGLEVRAFARRNKCKRAVIISDNDKPGLDGAHKVGNELRMPFAVYVPPAKDVREFIRLGGTRVMIENTIHNTVWRNVL